MADVGIGIHRVIQDADGEAATVTGGRLDVNAELIVGDVNVGNIDVLSVIPGTGATNLGKAEDAAHTSGDVGVMPLAVRKDTLVNLVGLSGDYAPLQVSEDGGLWVSLDMTTGNSKYFNIASTTSSSSQYGSIPLIKMNDAVTAPSGHVDNDWTYFQTNIKGALYTTGAEVENAAVQSQPSLIGGRYDVSPRGLDNGDAGAVALNVRGEVIVSIPAGNQAWIAREDSAHTHADYGITAMTVRNDVLATLSTDDADGDYQPLQVDAQGALYTTHGVTGMQSDNNEGVDDSTAEVLKSSTACKRVDMQADSANTGYIYVGGSDVSATKGIRLAPGDFYSIDCDNTADIYVLASVDEEDIHFTYYR